MIPKRKMTTRAPNSAAQADSVSQSAASLRQKITSLPDWIPSVLHRRGFHQKPIADAANENLRRPRQRNWRNGGDQAMSRGDPAVAVAHVLPCRESSDAQRWRLRPSG